MPAGGILAEVMASMLMLISISDDTLDSFTCITA